MTDEDASKLFGFEESGLGFMEDTSATGDMKSDPSGSSEDARFDSTGWDFPSTDPFATFNPMSTGPSMQPTYETTTWDPSFFDAGQSPVFDSLSSPENNQMFLFGSSGMPTDEKSRFRTTNMHTSRNTVTAMTPAQQEKLRNIAMPPHLQYHSPNSASSPESLTAPNKTGSSDNDTSESKGKSKKRKISDADHEDEEEEDDDEGKPVKKTSHNMIEKRYRNNLNDKIAALRDAVPSLRIMSKSARGEDTTEDRQELHGLTPAHKLNKATVLSKATEYIRHLEKRYSRLQEENTAMRARISAFEKLFMAGAMNGSMAPSQPPPTPIQFGGKNAQPKEFSSVKTSTEPSTSSPAGMIQVPDDMKRILAAQMASNQPYGVPQQPFRGGPQTLLQQQQIHQQQQMQQGRWGNAAPYFGKLMVGSLAGLMIMEALQEEEVSNEKPEGRGLFALPVHLLGKLGSLLDFNCMGYHTHTSLKLLLLLGTMMWVFIPSLFAPPRPSPKKSQSSTLQSAPSLASSTLVREAWVTAVQNVWIPRHNFIIEASALILKAIKLSLYNVVGLGGYQLLTGLTQEQETARVHAWTIALDSQLAGGDEEINTSRLILTLLASGTLPDTPSRLMLKSLHIRILLWNSSSGKFGLGLVGNIAAALARSKWNQARQLNRLLKQASASYATQYDDALPEHLAALVEQECDDVLNYEILQRAYNLAFNRDTECGIQDSIEAMDSVIFDSAVGSPLDAVAAWWSTQTLHQALTATIAKDTVGPDSRDDKLEAAVNAAPVGSEARVRAIVARAAFCDNHRGANIAIAASTLGTDKLGIPRHGVDHIESGTYVRGPDLQLSLRCATAIAHLKRSRTKAKIDLRALDFVNTISIPNESTFMSLLGFAATLELTEQLFEHKAVAENFSTSLERLAGSLRIWIGGSSGAACSIDRDVRHQVVDRCLSITKSLVGMDLDHGYYTQSEPDC